METVRRKKLTKKQFPWYRRWQVQLMGWMHLMIFTQIIHLQIDKISQGRKKDNLNVFQNALDFGLDDCQFWERRFT